jgi:hypothetical protein
VVEGEKESTVGRVVGGTLGEGGGGGVLGGHAREGERERRWGRAGGIRESGQRACSVPARALRVASCAASWLRAQPRGSGPVLPWSSLAPASAPPLAASAASAATSPSRAARRTCSQTAVRSNRGQTAVRSNRGHTAVRSNRGPGRAAAALCARAAGCTWASCSSAASGALPSSSPSAATRGYAPSLAVGVAASIVCAQSSGV